jgi:SAM-dependent methyltransferase
MKKEWFENWFDSPFYHLLYKARDESEAQKSLDSLALALDLAPNARVLDLACGKGRHSKYLAGKGYFVTGLDLSESSIEYARYFENERLEFFQHDMRKPFRSNYYDAVLNMFTSFGYFETDKEHLLALKNMQLNLKKDGKVLLDFFNSNWVRAHLVEWEEKQVDDIEFRIERKVEGGKVYKTISFDEGFQYRYTEMVRLFELADFQALFNACQLKITHTFGDYNLEEYDPQHSRRLILVATKING